MLEIYHFPLCPFSRKLRIALREKSVEFELFQEKYWERKSGFLKMNPRGDTPVIKTEDGLVVYGRNTVFEFIEESYPEPSLIGEGLAFRANVRKVSEWFDDKLYMEVTRYMILEKIIKPAQGSGAPNSDFIRAAKRNLESHMKYMEYLLDKNIYLSGEKVTLSDISAAAQLSVLDFTNDINWEKSHRIKEWYALMKSRPSFRSILHDLIPGIVPPMHYSDPDF